MCSRSIWLRRRLPLVRWRAHDAVSVSLGEEKRDEILKHLGGHGRGADRPGGRILRRQQRRRWRGERNCAEHGRRVDHNGYGRHCCMVRAGPAVTFKWLTDYETTLRGWMGRWRTRATSTAHEPGAPYIGTRISTVLRLRKAATSLLAKGTAHPVAASVTRRSMESPALRGFFSPPGGRYCGSRTSTLLAARSAATSRSSTSRPRACARCSRMRSRAASSGTVTAARRSSSLST